MHNKYLMIGVALLAVAWLIDRKYGQDEVKAAADRAVANSPENLYAQNLYSASNPNGWVS